MCVNLSDVELGFAVDLRTLRQVLRGLSVDGRRWWVASEPSTAVEDGGLLVGHGDRHCLDRLNTAMFRVGVLNDEIPEAGPDRLVLLLEPSSISVEEPGLYLEKGIVCQDYVEDLMCFYRPIKQALIARLQSAGNSGGEK